MKRSAKSKRSLKSSRKARRERRNLSKAVSEGRVASEVVEILGEDRKISCPAELSIHDNFTQTIEFFQTIKKLALVLQIRSKLQLKRDIDFVIELAEVRHISIRCALILTAEIDRLCRIGGISLSYSGDASKNTEALQVLMQMGFFDYLKMDANLAELKAISSHRAAIPILSGLKCPDAEFDEFNDNLKRICKSYQGLAVVEGAMAEAMLNVVHHAYIRKIELKYPHCGHRWWATASYNEAKKEMRFLVYDQGHGIGQTLPATGYQKLLMQLFESNSASFWKRDAALISAAIKMSRSRTKIDGRGRGFIDIQKPLRLVPGSRLRILSGHAEVNFSDVDVTISSELVNHIGGTLLEWIMPTGSVETLEEESYV
jgi:hypothetical protein